MLVVPHGTLIIIVDAHSMCFTSCDNSQQPNKKTKYYVVQPFEADRRTKIYIKRKLCSPQPRKLCGRGVFVFMVHDPIITLPLSEFSSLQEFERKDLQK